MQYLPITRAVLSVTDKTGIAEFGRFLADAGVELISTGGTFSALRAAGLPVTQVSEVTGFPEIMNGRVKTLHPKIHGGILADKDNPDHLLSLAQHSIAPFDLICVNLYKFDDALKKGLPEREMIEEIDIGGPCMLRAAAKNFHSILVVPGVSWYDRVRQDLEQNNMQASLELRRETAGATFAATAAYDAAIAGWFGKL